jgi:hypothetical protein
MPIIPLIAASQDPAGMGEPIDLKADERLSGDVYLIGPDGDLASGALEAGKGSINVPQGLSPGLYGLRLNQDEAWGTVTIVDSPGLLIRGAPYVSEGEEPRVEAFVHGIGAGTVVAVELTSGGTVERMVPHPLLGMGPVPATSSVQGIGEGRHQLVLPEGFTGTVRLVADDSDTLADPYSETDPAIVSNELQIQTCDETSTITGDLGMSGVITVRSAGVSNTIRAGTEDGAFEIAVPAGTNLITAVRDDGNHPPPAVVRVQCGGNLEVGDLTGQIDSGPQSGTYLGGLTLDDLWVYAATASGDLEFRQEGFADCTVLDGALRVKFGASSADPWLYQLTLDPPITTGKYEGQLHLEDAFTRDVAEGVLSGEIEVARIDGLDAVGGAFSGTVEGTLGSVDLDISFTCAIFSLTGSLPAPAVGSGLLGPAVPIRPVSAQISGGLASNDWCKRLFIRGIQPEGEHGIEVLTDWWATHLMTAVPRTTILTNTDVEVLQDNEYARKLLGTSSWGGGGLDLGEALQSDYLLHVSNTRAGDRWFFSAVLYDRENVRRLTSLEASGETAHDAIIAALDRWVEIVGPLANAGICAEFAPSEATIDIGQSEDFTVEVTNLAGEPAESPKVTETGTICGSWNPHVGPIEGDTWNTTFTAGANACRETASARVEAEGTVDTVYAIAETSITVEAMWQWATTITFEDAHGRITAESDGEFFVESDFDALIGSGTGYIEGSGEAYCEVNGAVTWQPYELVGTYLVMISGQVTERPEIDAPWSVMFAPMGFRLDTEMTYLTSSACIEAGTYSNDVLGSFGAGSLVMYPHWYNNQPDGFLTMMRPVGDGIPFEESLIGLPGASIRGIIWRPQP